MREDMLEKLAAELEIRNLMSRMYILADTDPSVDEYVSYLTEDIVWEYVGDNPDSAVRTHLGSRLVGRDMIAADRQKIREGGAQGPGSGMFKVLTTVNVRVNDDGTAEADSYMLYLKAKDSTEVRQVVHNQDQFRRTDDGWKLSHRRFSVHGASPSPS